MISPNIELDRLKEAGLVVRSKQKIGKQAIQYSIHKPASVLGNTRKNHEVFIRGDVERIMCDAPSLKLFLEGEKWVLYLHDWIPGPGPGDFELSFSSISDVVDAIIDYYFGDPSKMNPPELIALDED